LGGVFEFVSESAVHRDATTGAGIVDQPTHRQRLGTSRGDFERNLIGSSTDTTSLGLNPWLGVFDSAIEEFEGIDRLGLFIQDVDCGINNPFSDRALSANHHAADEVSDEFAIVARVFDNWFFVNTFPASHSLRGVED
jgi:hypothetical protein